jgi:hypothetical protein
MAAPVKYQESQTAPRVERILRVRMEAWRIGGCESEGKDAGMVRLPLVGVEDNSLCRQKAFLRMGGYWAPHRLPLVGDRRCRFKAQQKPLDTGGLLMEAATVRSREKINFDAEDWRAASANSDLPRPLPCRGLFVTKAGFSRFRLQPIEIAGVSCSWKSHGVAPLFALSRRAARCHLCGILRPPTQAQPLHRVVSEHPP